MSHTDFQNRLLRINANSPQQQPTTDDTTYKQPVEGEKPKYGRVAIGAAMLGLGVQAVRYANENYEAIKASSGIGAAVGLGLAGIVVLLIGANIIIRPKLDNTIQPRRQTSSRAKVISSLFGFVLGVIACFYIFMAVAARFIETENAHTFSIGGIGIALLLAFISLLLGLVGFFFRGYSLGRVPLYFFFGGALVFATVRILRINMLEWSQFVTMLQ